MSKQKILLNDTFTGSNSTALTSHYPDKCYVNSAWAALTGTIPQIQSNKASAAADATNYSAYIDLTREHIQVEADITAGTTSGSENYVIIFMRCLNANNFIGVQVGETSSASFNLNITRRAGGSSSTMATRSCTFADATQYHISIKCSGNLIYVSYGDGGADLQYHFGIANQKDAFANRWFSPGTKVGFLLYVGATSTTYPLIDNFKVLG